MTHPSDQKSDAKLGTPVAGLRFGTRSPTAYRSSIPYAVYSVIALLPCDCSVLGRSARIRFKV